jgi:hypothetical protein
MQQTHLERPLVLGSKREAGLLEKLAHVGLQPYPVGRLPAAGRSRLHEDAVPDLAGAREALPVLEAVVAAKPADGLAIVNILTNSKHFMLASQLVIHKMQRAFVQNLHKMPCSWLTKESTGAFRGLIRVSIDDYSAYFPPLSFSSRAALAFPLLLIRGNFPPARQSP